MYGYTRRTSTLCTTTTLRRDRRGPDRALQAAVGREQNIPPPRPPYSVGRSPPALPTSLLDAVRAGESRTDELALIAL